jgi:hypothetical protein
MASIKCGVVAKGNYLNDGKHDVHEAIWLKLI